MKKYGLKLLVGLITFAIGLVISWLNLTVNITYKDCELSQTPIQKVIIPTNGNGKIEIRFKGYGRIENRPTLIFEITNYNSKSAKYWSFSEKTISPFVKFNGKKREELRCGTGLKEFKLQSGKSFTTEIMADIYTREFLKKQGKFQFGYYFSFEEQESKEFWSDPIMISDEWEKDIIENTPSFLKENYQ
ncbi:MAG TPA: hypothetical protein PKE69_13090 [Pyrinomonadaceae bacterium]|nr:hypothetical protein [Pyrinomonadaceae bacterium]